MEGHRSPIIVAVDVVLFAVRDGKLHVLLVERGRPPFQGTWALPGGLVEPEEPLSTAARRELAEETGIVNVPYLRQLAAFGQPQRDPRGRVISIAYLGLLPQTEAVRGADDAARAAWWSVDALPSLAFDHANIVTCAVQRLRCLLTEDPRLLFHLVPIPFVMSELRHAYEGVMGKEIDKRNFRRLILRHNWVEPGDMRPNKGRGRPAREYWPREGVVPHAPSDECP